jgi:hypothetical protein
LRLRASRKPPAPPCLTSPLAPARPVIPATAPPSPAPAPLAATTSAPRPTALPTVLRSPTGEAPSPHPAERRHGTVDRGMRGGPGAVAPQLLADGHLARPVGRRHARHTRRLLHPTAARPLLYPFQRTSLPLSRRRGTPPRVHLPTGSRPPHPPTPAHLLLPQLPPLALRRRNPPFLSLSQAPRLGPPAPTLGPSGRIRAAPDRPPASPFAPASTTRALPRVRLRPPRDARSLSRVWYDPRAMRRPHRILLNTATIASLVLCAATAAFWVRSYSRVEWVQRIDARGGGKGLMSASGEAVLWSRDTTGRATCRPTGSGAAGPRLPVPCSSEPSAGPSSGSRPVPSPASA